ncbi:chemotaxis protein CheA [Methanonatronarchaeum sp. AMET-Sl]|uniref:chemotaxis protein CheA n=1 Tax=Methanonatronarchaeum sp. AMET-Sl TaxID=3037654 RepID=UPI00244DCA4F|nr:chemotaxis protein CheA [Methanonatronarchaeum sp. AMET-Sl]WGI17825.1 chemotaxis protein CheA [Methanonatronarchaeum sp. AMET-Sl]
MEEYLESFVLEGKEMLTEINNALLKIEKDPENREAIDSVFRAAHTLKGNFGAMGFQGASDLSHAIEDLLDGVRSKEIEVTSKKMDSVFKGVDTIESMLNEIEESGETTIDPSPIIDDIRSEIENSSTPSDNGETEVKDGWLNEIEVFDGYYIEIELENLEMKGIDAKLLFKSLDGLEVVKSNPPIDEVYDGEYDARIEFVCSIDTSIESIKDKLDNSSKVGEYIVKPVKEVLDNNEDEIEFGKDIKDLETTKPSVSSVSDGQSMEKIQSVRVDTDQIDSLMNRVKELVTTRIRIRQSIDSGETLKVEKELKELDKLSSKLQNIVMDIRLVPLKKVVSKFPRMVRDLANSEGKKIDLIIKGDDLELDRTVLNEIGDPLMHLLRNAVDHGIEPPEERIEAGKPEVGEIVLEGRQEQGKAVIEVKDDGQGLDADAIKEKALERGVVNESQVDDMSDNEIYELIFESGFSTSSEVTEVSGRGVGMDVVKNTISKLDGSIDISSDPGKGTNIKLSLPFTVSIIKVLLIEVGNEVFGIPVKNLDKILNMENSTKIDGQEIMDIDGETYRVHRLGEVFKIPDSSPKGMCLKIKDEISPMALQCDKVIKIEEVVVKTYGSLVSNTPGIAGAAIMGEGKVINIIDVDTLRKASET